MTIKQNQAGVSILDLIISMVEQQANTSQTADKQAQFNIEHGNINHRVQPDNPDYLPIDDDFDAKGFEQYMTHMFGDYPDYTGNYYDDTQEPLIEDDVDNSDPEYFVDYDSLQHPINIYIENINVVIERD